MRRIVHGTALLAIASAGLGAAVSGCSGPQPLDLAIDPRDEAAYAATCEAPGETPRHAFLAARAAQRGIPFEEADRFDRAISPTENPFQARSDQPAVSRGAVIYRHECMVCHGEHADGRGGQMPVQLESMDFHRFSQRVLITLKGGAKEKWFRTISQGVTVDAKDPEGAVYSVAMPAFSDRLAREQIWLAITYLQSLDRDLPPRAPETAR